MWTTHIASDSNTVTHCLNTTHVTATLLTASNSTEYMLIAKFNNPDEDYQLSFTAKTENDAKQYAKQCMRHFLNTMLQHIEEMRNELL